MPTELINANPIVYGKQERRNRKTPSDEDESVRDLIDEQEIFDHIRDIKDPEHPYSLEELKVVTEDAIEVNDPGNHVRVTFTPTVEHCSMAQVIGLCLRVKLMRSLPPRFKGQKYTKALVKVIGGTNDPIEDVIKKMTLLWKQVTPVLEVDIRVAPGTHATEAAVNKQLNDKERVAAALENPNLLEMVDECLASSYEY